MKYTVVEAKEYIEKTDTKYDTMAFHVLTNGNNPNKNNNYNRN